MQNEVNFIQELLRSYLHRNEERNHLKNMGGNLNNELLLEKIFANGLEGIAYYELNRTKLLDLFPRNFVDKLKWGSRNTLIVNILLYEEFLNLLREFKKNGIDILPVKGILFVKELYDNMSLRPMVDIDFFVREDEYNSAIALLKSLGYKESDFLPVRRWERENFRIALTKKTQIPITVELHRRFSQPGRFELSITDALENVVTKEVDGEIIRTFNDDFSFLFLIHHLGMHYFNVKLIWVVDIVKFLYKAEVNWNRINEYVNRYKLRSVFYMTVKLLSQYMERKKLPDYYYVPNLIKRGYLNLFFTENSLNFFRFPTMNLRIAQIFGELPLIDGVRDRIKFLKNYLRIRVSDYL